MNKLDLNMLTGYCTADIEARLLATCGGKTKLKSKTPAAMIAASTPSQRELKDAILEAWKQAGPCKLQTFEWCMTKSKQPRRVKVRKPFRW